MKKFLGKHWFLVGLALVLVVGLTIPDRLEFLRQAKTLRNLVVACVLFVTTLPLETKAIGASIKRPWPPLLASLVNYGLVPILAIIAAKFLSGDWSTGMIAAAAAPCTIASAAVWTRRAGGNDVVALMVTVITNLMCFVLTPLWLVIGLGKDKLAMVESSDALSLGTMIQKLAILVLVPMLLGQILRQNQNVAEWSTTNKKRLSRLAQVGILAIVLVGAVHCGKYIAGTNVSGSELIGHLFATLFAVIAVHTIALFVGQSLGRAFGFAREDWIAVGFAGSQKTLMVGLHVALMVGGGLAILPMVAYHVCQLIIDTLVADRLNADPSLRGSAS